MLGASDERDRNPIFFLSAVLVLNCLFLAWMGWVLVRFYPEARSARERWLRMEELRGIILRLDETLTMSARMAAATGDLRWESRYREHLQQLDSAIEEAKRLANEARSPAPAARTDEANRKLVAMENRAFSLIRGGRPERAEEILDSLEYETQKRAYSDGMNALAGDLAAAGRSGVDRIRRQASIYAVVILTLVPCLVVSLALVVRAVHRWRAAITKQNLLLRKAYDDLRELDRMKSAFLDISSHELSTPVSCLEGMLEILGPRIPAGDTQAVQAQQSALRGALRLQRLLAQILRVADTGSYTERLDLKTEKLELLIHQTADEVRPFVQLRGLNLELKIPGTLPPARIDADKIRDVLLNLLMNAIKFTPEGGHIQIEASTPDAQFIEVSVRDDGVGIAEGDKPHVFEEFFTSFNTLTHSSGTYEFEKRGIGLGLAIVARFVKMHGGKTGLESEVNKGTRVWFTLPTSTPRSAPDSAPAGFG